MTAVPLLSGVAGSETGEFVQVFPVNLEPMAVDSKISTGQFRAPAAPIQIGAGPGPDRGGIVWNGRHYRAMGTQLCEIGTDGTVIQLGNIDNSRRVNFDYSFDRLIIPSSGDLFYFDGAAVVQVTDPDIGNVIDAIWIDGYTMTTDGTYVLVTELNDPLQVKPLKYGSAESDPDEVTGLIRYRDEAYVLGRYTIELFRNVGGTGFPFATVKGGTIPFGCVGPWAKCLFGDGFAFVGSARGESINVFAGGQGQAVPFGNKAICQALAAIEDPYHDVLLEERSYGGEQRLLVHLPTETWCFLAGASRMLGQPIWYRLQGAQGIYTARNAVEWNGRLIVGDIETGAIGELSEGEPRQFGVEVEWSFEAGMLYNDSLGVLLDSVELVGLPGRGKGDGTIFLSMTRDGETWSQERPLTIRVGERSKRLQWRPHVRFGNYMGLRFRGHGVALPGIARLEIKGRPLTS